MCKKERKNNFLNALFYLKEYILFPKYFNVRCDPNISKSWLINKYADKQRCKFQPVNSQGVPKLERGEKERVYGQQTVVEGGSTKKSSILR